MPTKYFIKTYGIVIFTLFLITAHTSVAQKCQYEKDELDAVTELKIKRTKPIEITRVNDHPLYIKGQCIGPNKYLKIRYYRYNAFEIRSNEPLEIIFEDESSVRLEAREMPEQKNTGGFVKVSSMLIYNLTKDQYKQLLEKPAIEIKYFIEGGGYVRKGIRNKYKHDIQHIMQCILLDSDNL